MKFARFFVISKVEFRNMQLLLMEKKKTTYLALRNSVTSSLNSFLNKISSRKSIKAISDCNLKVIDLENFQKLMKNNEVFKQFYHNLIEKQIMLIDDYRIDLLTLTPEERYKKLLQTEPSCCKKFLCIIWLPFWEFLPAT
jgi:CRP-like cAMP-binding protein